jgi:hypothetical protein
LAVSIICMPRRLATHPGRCAALMAAGLRWISTHSSTIDEPHGYFDRRFSRKGFSATSLRSIASDHVGYHRHAGFFCRLRILPGEIFIDELGKTPGDSYRFCLSS